MKHQKINDKKTWSGGGKKVVLKWKVPSFWPNPLPGTIMIPFFDTWKMKIDICKTKRHWKKRIIKINENSNNLFVPRVEDNSIHQLAYSIWLKYFRENYVKSSSLFSYTCWLACSMKWFGISMQGKAYIAP